MTAAPSPEGLAREVLELRDRLEEAESTLRAIRGGRVDAFMVDHGAGDQVLVLDGVDRPYRLLIERMNQAVLNVTDDGTIIYANRRLGELVGLPTAALVGSHLGAHLDADDRGAFHRLLALALERDAGANLALVRSDGERLPVHLAAAPLIEERHLVSLIVTDRSEQLRTERERAQFLQAEAARTAAESVARALQDADRRKDEFLAMLAHELRNPLAPLRNGLAILNTVGTHSPEAEKTRAMMERQVQNLVHMVDDLLDVGRVTQGKITLLMKRTDLRDIVWQAVDSSRPFVSQHRHLLEVRCPDQPVLVEGDQIRLTQVMVNLLTNAIKFTPEGGRIDVELREEDPAWVTLHVRDTGVGIAPEMQATIFDLFTQAESTINRTEGGLGIGLTLSRRLVEMHQGKLSVRSEGLGCGSEFIVRLPRGA
jgi:PAS domain S-box-containing protein